MYPATGQLSKLAAYGLNPAHAEMEWPDLGSVAQALGAKSATVNTIEELRDAVQEATN